MTLSELKLLHAYNSWADNRIFEALAQLSPEQYTQDMKGSHGGIQSTLVHLVGAEKVWLERFQGDAQPFLSEHPPGSLADLKGIWEKVGYDTATWLSSMNDKKLQEA